MIKIKTFIYEVADFATYNSRKIGMRHYYYDLDASKIDEEINNFTKNHAVISVTPVTFVEGDRDPTPIIMYTIVYEEAE